MSGTVTATGSTTPVDVVFELGGKVKVQGPGRSIVFRKKTNQQAVSASDKAWIESLVDDLADSALPAIASGAQVRLLGRRFSDGSGGFCDMYDIAVPLSDSPTQTRWKRFCFDSATSTLKFVRYPSTLSANATIETQFSDWRVINGQAVPGRIARVEGGVTIFVIQAQSVAVSSRSDDGLFGN